MDQTQLTQAVGGIRTGIGAALLAMPGVAGRIWIGPGAASPGAKVLARAVGARDVVVGLRTFEAAEDVDRSRLWLQIGFLSDAADVTAALLAWRQLSPIRRMAVPLVAGAVGVAGYQAWKATREEGGEPSPEEVLGQDLGTSGSDSGSGGDTHTASSSGPRSRDGGASGPSSSAGPSPAPAPASSSTSSPEAPVHRGRQLDEQRLLSLEEAADELDTPVEQVRAMVDEGLLEPEEGSEPPRFLAARVRAAHNLGG